MLLEGERVPDWIGRNEDRLRADGIDLAERHPDPDSALDRLGGGIGDERSAHGWRCQDEGETVERGLVEDGQAQGEMGDEQAREGHRWLPGVTKRNTCSIANAQLCCLYPHQNLGQT